MTGELLGECSKIVLTLAMADHDYPNGMRFTREALREAADSDPCLSFCEATGFLECETDVTGLRELMDGRQEIEFTFPICPALFEAGIVECGASRRPGLDLSIIDQTVAAAPEELQRAIEAGEKLRGLHHGTTEEAQI